MGSIYIRGVDWTRDPLMTVNRIAACFPRTSAFSIRIGGDAYKENCAYQNVPIYQTGKIYVLFGWAKADAIPDKEEREEGEDVAAQDKYKQFGLQAARSITMCPLARM